MIVGTQMSPQWNGDACGNADLRGFFRKNRKNVNVPVLINRQNNF
jgi:hypothetical protein